MPVHDPKLTRRLVLAAGAVTVLQSSTAFAAAPPLITVYRAPTCGCCGGWVEHLKKAGFETNVINTGNVDAVKKRFGVPDDLASCHTAEVMGYAIEGHVPASALKRFLSERPSARGLAVPGMPIGAPGMEGGRPELYEVVMFGPDGRRTYQRFLGDRPI